MAVRGFLAGCLRTCIGIAACLSGAVSRAGYVCSVSVFGLAGVVVGGMVCGYCWPGPMSVLRWYWPGRVCLMWYLGLQ